MTDGLDDSSKLEPICNKMKREGFIINIVGFDNDNFFFFMRNKSEKSSFEHLRKFASENCFFTSKNINEVQELCQNIFAAE